MKIVVSENGILQDLVFLFNQWKLNLLGIILIQTHIILRDFKLYSLSYGELR